MLGIGDYGVVGDYGVAHPPANAGGCAAKALIYPLAANLGPLSGYIMIS